MSPPSSSSVSSLPAPSGTSVAGRLRQATPAAPWPLSALLARADVRTDGKRPWDLRVHRRRLYRRVLTGWSLGLAISF